MELGVTLHEVSARWDFCDATAISRWERGLTKNLPGKRTAEDYAATLDALAGVPA